MPHFYFLSGGGNDFIALAEPDRFPVPDEIRSWTTRGLSLGADGLFVLGREDGGVRMDYFNADGSRGELCLNGTRSAARLAFHLGWARDAIEIETDAGKIAAESAGENRVRLAVPPPGALRQAAPELTDGEERRRHPGWLVTVGVPHFVLLGVEDLGQAPVESLGRRLRHHPDFAPAGANVDFARLPDPGSLEIRTYERGVEAETLACGTGVLATVAAAVAAGQAEPPVGALTRGGFTLEVETEVGEDRRIQSWTLTGDARLVAEGELHPGAEGLPTPPSWSKREG